MGNITSVLCAKHKDVSNIIGILLNIGFWVTPIFWNAGEIGGRLNTLIMLNPVAIIINGYRKALLYGGYLTGGEFIYLICVCVAIFVLSHFLKRRYLPTIADNL